MAGDWIKIRPNLLTSPKVNGIARILESDSDVARTMTTGFNGAMCEIVTRNVMRNVTLSCLVTVWGAANEHTNDGVFKNADLHDIDDIAGLPGFGMAMEAVGWAIYDEDADSVTLPNFNEYNTCGKDRAKENNRERQRRYREKQKAESGNSNANSNVTSDVINNDREEKRREENKTLTSPAKTDGMPDCPYQQIVDSYHQHCPTMNRVKVMTEPRKKAVRARWREDKKHQCIEFWDRYFEYANQSDFLTGKVKDFAADFEWLIKSSNFAKVVEGRYHGERAA